MCTVSTGPSIPAGAMSQSKQTPKRRRCRDTKGKFIECETSKKKFQCKYAKGKFANCGTAFAISIN